MKTFLICLFLLFPSLANSRTLILIVDVSASISSDNKILVKESYTKAFDELYLFEGLYLEVLLFGNNVLLAGSGTIDDVKKQFDMPTEQGIDSTCLEKPLQLVLDRYDTFSKPVVIDITSDGAPNCNEWEKIPSLLDALEEKGAVINTLYVVNPNMKQSILAEEYRRGRGSFSMSVTSYNDFEEALFRKLTAEIALME